MSAMDVDAPPPVPLKAAKAAPSFLPWVEKYRPVTLDDVVGNDEAVGRLKTISHNGNLPNVILAGPPGSGKTSSVLCLARQMLGACGPGGRGRAAAEPQLPLTLSLSDLPPSLRCPPPPPPAQARRPRKRCSN